MLLDSTAEHASARSYKFYGPFHEIRILDHVQVTAVSQPGVVGDARVLRRLNAILIGDGSMRA